jgi:hypothetical protein
MDCGLLGCLLLVHALQQQLLKNYLHYNQTHDVEWGFDEAIALHSGWAIIKFMVQTHKWVSKF